MRWVVMGALLSLFACGPAPPQRVVDKCAEFGWTPGTEGYAACRQSLYQQNQALKNAVTAPLLYNAMQPPRPVLVPPPPTVR